MSLHLIQLINKALCKAGAPANLVVTVSAPSIENTNAMMSHPKIRMLVATGGPAIVKTVLSSGKKAIGAGARQSPRRGGRDRRHREGRQGYRGRLLL